MVNIDTGCKSYGAILQRKMEKSSTGIFLLNLQLYPGRYEVCDTNRLGYAYTFGLTFLDDEPPNIFI